MIAYKYFAALKACRFRFWFCYVTATGKLFTHNRSLHPGTDHLQMNWRVINVFTWNLYGFAYAIGIKMGNLVCIAVNGSGRRPPRSDTTPAGDWERMSRSAWADSRPPLVVAAVSPLLNSTRISERRRHLAGADTRGHPRARLFGFWTSMGGVCVL